MGIHQLNGVLLHGIDPLREVFLWGLHMDVRWNTYHSTGS